MKTISQISQEITTNIRELSCGRFEITCTHISGEFKTGMAGSNHAGVKSNVLHNTLISRIANSMEVE